MMYAVVPPDFDPSRESPRTLFHFREAADCAAELDRAEGIGSRVVCYRVSMVDVDDPDLSGPEAQLAVILPDEPDLLPARPRWGVTVSLQDAPPGRVRVLGKIPAALCCHFDPAAAAGGPPP